MTDGADLHLVAWVVLQRDDGHLLLARRADVPYAAGRWGLPGGHVDVGETFAAAAAREAREEVGVAVDPQALEPLGIQHWTDDGLRGLDVFFRARSWDGEPHPVAECDAVHWFPAADLPPDALDWLADCLGRFLGDGPWFDEMGF